MGAVTRIGALPERQTYEKCCKSAFYFVHRFVYKWSVYETWALISAWGR